MIHDMKQNVLSPAVYEIYSQCMYAPSYEKFAEKARFYLDDSSTAIYGFYENSTLLGVIVLQPKPQAPQKLSALQWSTPTSTGISGRNWFNTLRQSGAMRNCMPKLTMMQSHFMSAAVLKWKRFRLHTMGFHVNDTAVPITYLNHFFFVQKYRSGTPDRYIFKLNPPWASNRSDRYSPDPWSCRVPATARYSAHA